jgi:hypothetical protein
MTVQLHVYVYVFRPATGQSASRANTLHEAAFRNPKQDETAVCDHFIYQCVAAVRLARELHFGFGIPSINWIVVLIDMSARSRY